MYRNLQTGNSSGTYNIKDIPTGLSRSGMAAAFFFTIPGPKMIWQFGELGYDISIDFGGRVGNKPMKWNYFNEVERRKLYNTYAALINLKISQPAFRSDKVTLVTSAALKTITILDPSMNVRIIGNFGLVSGSFVPNFPDTGTWYDYFTGDSIVVVDKVAKITLMPGEYHIYTSKALKVPDMTVGMLDLSSTASSDWDLMNFPNPASENSTITFDVNKTNKVAVKIYNIMGAEVKSFADQTYAVGHYDMQWDLKGNNGATLPNGIYFINVLIGNESRKSKVILNQ